ncbi:HD domain-containing protein [Methanoplanus sp. FWC-SCC4]|uniref:HD domain-containing protein n=1 Tax=Methanochimaera problematica TaxID=2609417 RepID=A0AA97FB50_9EURY|nr:HD domain-containing protein [Methanoplanus sp. FWC-SCC4]WOF15729.1 HD domain-containing protein [Methanoplanus sp. FWC-SCC4]
MKIIKDPVHGYVEVDERILPLLDSVPVQRLRYIKQLGFSHMVYPGANHTRFEHSLGTMHLARLMSQSLNLSSEDVMLVTVSALLHDIGHGPYSHATEGIMEKYTKRSHQEIKHLVTEGPVAEELFRIGIEPAEICSMIEGEHNLAGIIHGDLDVDRMDYLLRDAHYTGVPYGTVDAHRLIRSSIITDKGLVLKENGINAAESLLIARTLMRPAVYFHHVSRIAEAMVKKAAIEHLKSIGFENTEYLLNLYDGSFFMEISNSASDVSKRLMKSLYQRNLYKRAIYVGMDQVKYSSLLKVISLKDEDSIAAVVCEATGLPDEKVLVDIPALPSSMSIEVQVRNHNDLLSLESLSPLTKTLNETRKQQWRLGIYTTPDNRRIVEEAAYEILNIEKPTKQDKLII